MQNQPERLNQFKTERARGPGNRELFVRSADRVKLGANHSPRSMCSSKASPMRKGNSLEPIHHLAKKGNRYYSKKDQYKPAQYQSECFNERVCQRSQLDAHSQPFGGRVALHEEVRPTEPVPVRLSAPGELAMRKARTIKIMRERLAAHPEPRPADFSVKGGDQQRS